MTHGDTGYDPTRTVQAEPATYRMGFPQEGRTDHAAGDGPVAATSPPGGGGAPGWLVAVLTSIVVSVIVVIIVWFALIKPNIKDTVQSEVASRTGQTVATNSSSSSGQAPIATTPLPISTPAAAVGTGNTLGDPVDNRLTASVSQGQSTSASNPPASTVIKVSAGQVLSVTDVVFSNPNGDSGSVELRRDGQTLLSFSLGNFRDQDYHFVAPVTFRPGQTMQLVVTCTQVGSGSPGGTAPSSCNESVFYSGYQKGAA